MTLCQTIKKKPLKINMIEFRKSKRGPKFITRLLGTYIPVGVIILYILGAIYLFFRGQ